MNDIGSINQMIGSNSFKDLKILINGSQMVNEKNYENFKNYVTN